MCWPHPHQWFWIGRNTGGADVWRCVCGVTEMRPQTTIVVYTSGAIQQTRSTKEH